VSTCHLGVPARARANRGGVRETGPVTVLLTRSLIGRAVSLDLGAAFRVLGDGFRVAAPAQAPLRARTDLPGPGTATCLMPKWQ
jgi:hypothetical protein